MVSKISDVPGCPGVDLELVLLPWMLVKLEADLHQCDPQRYSSLALLCSEAPELSICLGGTLMASFTGVVIFQFVGV